MIVRIICHDFIIKNVIISLGAVSYLPTVYRQAYFDAVFKNKGIDCITPVIYHLILLINFKTTKSEERKLSYVAKTMAHPFK